MDHGKFLMKNILISLDVYNLRTLGIEFKNTNITLNFQCAKKGLQTALLPSAALTYVSIRSVKLHSIIWIFKRGNHIMQ